MKDLTILVVDDEPDLGELVAFEFELVGASVLSASNGKEALDMVKKNNIDVVVSDIRMPGGDGVELLETLRNMNPRSPSLLFMTGFADITLEDAYDKGAVAMFGKPFNRKELIDAVSMSVKENEEKWNQPLDNTDELNTYTLNLSSFHDAQLEKKFALGRGGIYLMYEDSLPAVSEKVKFQLNFENGEVKNFSGQGIVRWVRRHEDGELKKGIGIEFRFVESENRDVVFREMNNLDNASYIPKG